MDENADASQAIYKPSSNLFQRTGRLHTNWTKNIRDDLSSLDLGIHEAIGYSPQLVIQTIGEYRFASHL